jgi:hypothetical protein
MVKITHTNSVHKLKVLVAGGRLPVDDVSGGFGLISNSDAGTIITTATASSAQRIATPEHDRR